MWLSALQIKIDWLIDILYENGSYFQVCHSWVQAFLTCQIKQTGGVNVSEWGQTAVVLVVLVGVQLIKNFSVDFQENTRVLICL